MKKHSELPPVNVHNDKECIDLGIRCPHVVPRDKTVWTKSPKEKHQLKKMKRILKTPNISWAPPQKESRLSDRLIINIKNAVKTTYVIKNCLETNIDYILNKYEDVLVKAFYGGKQIYPIKS